MSTTVPTPGIHDRPVRASLRKRVLQLLRKIPRGKVTTYGVIANKVGISPREVAAILHENTDDVKFPCHRVVTAGGKLSDSYAFGGYTAQHNRLEGEGVAFRRDKVDMKKCKCEV